jgi:hypothetical protein
MPLGQKWKITQVCQKKSITPLKGSINIFVEATHQGGQIFCLESEPHQP